MKMDWKICNDYKADAGSVFPHKTDYREAEISGAQLVVALDRLSLTLLNAEARNDFETMAEAVEQFAKKFGLLGVYTHQAIQVRYSNLEAEKSAGYGKQVGWFFSAGVWTPDYVPVDTPEAQGFCMRHQAILPDSEDWFGFRKIPSWSLVSEPLSKWANRFFTSEQGLRSAPGSEDFWDSYKEPFEDWLFWGPMLRTATRAIIEPATVRNNPLVIDLARSFLNQAANKGGMIAVETDAGWTSKYNGPSLISLYAATVIDSLGTNKPVQPCQICDALFIPTRAGGKFCSTACKIKSSNQRRKALKEREAAE